MNGLVPGLNETRLRLALLVFFVALSLPAGLLIYRTWGQMRWEALAQYRAQAEALSATIDGELGRYLAGEEARPSADYNFLRVADDTEAVYAQRSPLSELVPAGAPAGLVGYFQVDSAGNFRSPLLPAAGVDAAVYGISSADLAARQAQSARIEAVLTADTVAPAALRAGRPARATPGQRESAVFGAAKNASPGASKVTQNAFDRLSEADRAPVPRITPGSYGRDAKLESELHSASSAKQAETRADVPARRKEQVALYAPALRVPSAPVPSAAEASQARSAPAEDIGERQGAAATATPAVDAVPAARASAALTDDIASAIPVIPPTAATRLPIRLFESELGPLTFALQGDRHCVLFRNVWRDGERSIQGLLLERDAWLGDFVTRAFAASPLAATSRLALAWQGQAFSIAGLAEGGPAADVVLYRSRLSAPLSGFELIYGASSLPQGSSAAYLAWVTLALVLALGGGCYAIYRYGVSQLTLFRQQQDFVSAVSHELKTPLTSIRMYSEMLRAGWVDESKKASYYTFIHDESERLSRLIANVLELARMTRGQYRPVLTTISLGAAVARIEPLLAQQLERAAFVLLLAVDPAASSALLALDEDAFTQILINLADNAVKFTPPGGERRLDIRIDAPRGNTVSIRVRDYGSGIAREHLRRIFDLFYRAESELTRDTVGTGIGLALVRQLTGAMGGTVDVRNCSPGAEFTLVLPLAASAADAGRAHDGT